MYQKRGFMVVVLGASMLLAPGCDDGDDSSGEDSMGEADTEGDGDGDPGDGDGDPGTGGDDKGDFGGEGGELMGCALNETAADCVAESGCASVYGNALLDDGNGGWCTDGAEQFIGCVSSLDLCPSLGKTLCEGDDIWRTTGCVPDSLEICEAPGEITGDC